MAYVPRVCLSGSYPQAVIVADLRKCVTKRLLVFVVLAGLVHRFLLVGLLKAYSIGNARGMMNDEGGPSSASRRVTVSGFRPHGTWGAPLCGLPTARDESVAGIDHEHAARRERLLYACKL